ncbi:MAG TPA: hypothetical protein VGR00_09230 [Thermoanaerobaculia bacterium]|nr:hypothetical protein [Thermoanaerobaculia bacterium]
MSVLPLIALLLSPAMSPPATASPASKVTLRGQVVCSGCWGEEDRAKVAYGTPDDLDCAKRCAKRNVPVALAVGEGKSFRLLNLTSGAVQPGKDGWLEYVGKNVEVSGHVERTKEQEKITVDSIRALPAK